MGIHPLNATKSQVALLKRFKSEADKLGIPALLLSKEGGKLYARFYDDLADATNNTIFVPWFEVNEINGGTHNLTVDIYDGTNAVYVGSDGGLTWNAKAVTAKTAYLFTQGLVIPKGSLLRVTSSDASGYFHVHGVYVNVTG